MLKKGNGCSIDLEETLRYFKLTADKGNDKSMASLAEILYTGCGIYIYYGIP